MYYLLMFCLVRSLWLAPSFVTPLVFFVFFFRFDGGKVYEGVMHEVLNHQEHFQTVVATIDKHWEAS